MAVDNHYVLMSLLHDELTGVFRDEECTLTHTGAVVERWRRTGGGREGP